MDPSDAEPPFQEAAVAACFACFEAAAREQLLVLRAMIFEVAEQTPGVGALTETLKWGQPAYLTTSSKSGTTLRLHTPSEDRVALLVHCQTTLIRDFEALYPGEFEIDGTRAIHQPISAPLPTDALRDFVRKALTYHQR